MSWFHNKKNNTLEQVNNALKSTVLTSEEDWQAVYAICKDAINNDLSFIDELFKNWFKIGKDYCKNPKENALLLYQHTQLLASKKYLPLYHKYQVNYLQLSHIPKQFLPDFKTLIPSLLEVEDFNIIESQSYTKQGNVGDIIASVFGIFSVCISNYQKVPGLMANLSSYVKPFAEKHPNNGHYSMLDALENHEQPIEETAAILAILIKKQAENGLLSNILRDVIHPFSKDNFYHKNGTNIMESVLQQITPISQEHKNWLLQQVLQRLGINTKNKAQQIAEHTVVLERLLKNSEQFKMGIESRTKEVTQLKTNFENLQQNNWKKAYKKLAVSPKNKKLFETLAKHYKNLENTQLIIQLLADAKAFKARPKHYNLNQKPTVVFKDLHFKLWVIETLMYEQNLLQPKFNLNTLAEEHTAREINREDDGYAVIPEVKKYFKNLDIPHELLQKVTVLTVSYLSETYNHLWPFCDPGSGDQLLPVSNKMIDDLALVPNLNKIVGIEELNPSTKVLKALHNKGIILEEISY